MKKIVPFCIILILSCFLTIIYVTSVKAAGKLHFQYVVFPNTIVVGSEMDFTICIVNQGDPGQLIYDGSANMDQVTILIPIGNGPDDLIEQILDPTYLSCISQNPLWTYDPPIIIGNEILFTFHPIGPDPVDVQEGQTICFNIFPTDPITTPVIVNSTTGLAFLNVDQQIAQSRADNSKNGTMGVFKNDSDTTPYIETDPIFSEWSTTCWDLNRDGVCDPAEDKNGDTFCDAQDCTGAQGEPGLSCWDINGDGVQDPAEDINGDGVWDTQDCKGPQGDQGVAGIDGASGADGADGLNCWDINGDGVQDPAEDINGDGVWDTQDCQGSDGTSLWVDGTGQVTTDVLVGIGTDSPTEPLTVAGLIRSTSGGFKFPDGTIQTSAAISGSGIGGDAYTKLLMHMDDLVLSDSSPLLHTVFKNGDITRSTDQSVFGVYSAHFDGNGDFLKIPDSEDWSFGQANFTIDLWFQVTNMSIRRGLFGHWESPYSYLTVGVNSDGAVYLWICYNNSFLINIASSPGEITIGNWYHLAVVRNGSDWCLYKDGINVVSYSNNGTIQDYNGPFIIGGEHEWEPLYRPFHGYIDEFRVSKGIARWTSDFIPPIAPHDAGGSCVWAQSEGDVYRQTGSVGIGTDNPSSELDVVGTITADGLNLDGTVSGSGFSGWDNDWSDDLTTSTSFSGDITGTYNATVVGNDSHNHGDPSVSDNLSIDNGRFYAPSGAGNVGIGTTSPEGLLHIQSDMANLILKTPTDNRSFVEFHDGGGREWVAGMGITNEGVGDFEIFEYTDGIDQGSRLYIKKGGNLGIGTTSPAYKLHVDGDIYATGTIYGVSGTADTDWVESGGNVYRETGNVGIGTTSPGGKLDVGGGKFIVDDYGTLHISGNMHLRDTTGGTPMLAIYDSGGTRVVHLEAGKDNYLNGGNVGIGTTSPSQKLDVAGVINAQGFYINGSPFAGGGSQWTTSGSNIYYNAGNVGIGTTNPIYKLHVLESNNGVVQIESTDFDSVAGLVLQNDVQSWFLKVDGADGDNFIIRDSAVSRDRFIIDPSGNVGIGTTSPEALFEVHEENNSNGGEIAISNNSNDQLNLYLGGSGRGDGTARNGLIRVVRNDGSPGNLVLQGISGGNVGIGTTNPDCKLYVHGSYGVTFDFNESTFSGRIRFGTQGSRPAMLIDDGTGYAVVRIASAPNMAHFFNNGGNVGIGTTSPSYKLHVNGTAYATGAAGALSDRRHKTNISDLSFDALVVVNNLHPVTFEWKEPLDSGMEGTQLGFIAQEVEEVLPEAVLTQDNEEQTKGLKYNALIPLLTKAIQELEAQNEALKAENNSLRHEIEQIKEAIGL